MELVGKRMRRSTIINLICENVEDMVVLSARGYRNSSLPRQYGATLKMIKDDDEVDNLETTALDVVATYIKKECSMMDYKHQTYHTNTSKEIAEESAISSLSPNWKYHHQRHQETPYPIPNRARGVLQQKEDGQAQA